MIKLTGLVLKDIEEQGINLKSVDHVYPIYIDPDLIYQVVVSPEGFTLIDAVTGKMVIKEDPDTVVSLIETNSIKMAQYKFFKDHMCGE